MCNESQCAESLNSRAYVKTQMRIAWPTALSKCTGEECPPRDGPYVPVSPASASPQQADTPTYWWET